MRNGCNCLLLPPRPPTLLSRRFREGLAGVADLSPTFDDDRDNNGLGGCRGGDGLIDNDWVGRINATMAMAEVKVCAMLQSSD